MMKGKCLYDSLAGDEAESLAAEVVLGRDMAMEVGRQFGPCQQPEYQQQVEELGPELAARLRNKDIPFVFRVVHGPEPNAFALPGGPVFVTSAIIALCDSAVPEVAFILAHEMAHVVNRHPVERLMANSLFTALMRTLPARNAVGQWLKKAGLKVLSSAYSQEHELLADAFAVRLCQAAGLPNDGGAALLSRLLELQAGGNGSALSEYFSTHPPLEERIERIQSACAGK